MARMPHIRLFTSADLPENADLPEILHALAALVAETETVQPAKIKAYHQLLTNWTVGDGHPDGIAHCEVSVLAGREATWRAALAEQTLSKLRELFHASLEEGSVGLTVEVREMDAHGYRSAG